MKFDAKWEDVCIGLADDDQFIKIEEKANIGWLLSVLELGFIGNVESRLLCIITESFEMNH